MRATAHAHLRLIVSEPAAPGSAPAAVETASVSRTSSTSSESFDTGRTSMVQPVSTLQVWARQRRRGEVSLWLASAMLLVVAATLLLLRA
jgi:hypothetical protein